LVLKIFAAISTAFSPLILITEIPPAAGKEQTRSYCGTQEKDY
jgi:hypothetical protein